MIVTYYPPVKVDVSPYVDVIWDHVKRNGGIVSNFKERTQDEVYRDNFVGRSGEVALTLWLTGSVESYLTRVERLIRLVNVSDGGSDVDGYRVDIKTSRVNPKWGLNYPYCLWVRPREYHKDVAYILGVLEGHTVWMKGWATARDLGWDPGVKRWECLPYELHDMGTFDPTRWVTT